MKTLLLTILSLFSLFVHAQDAKTAMEKRAKEMHLAITSSDMEQWKTFMKENYTQALIDKPMRAKVVTSENGNTTSGTDKKAADNLEAKSGMFQQLHNDFSNSKIISLKPEGEKIVMTLQNAEGLNGIFTLRFENKSPWLIDGLGIEVNAEK